MYCTNPFAENKGKKLAERVRHTALFCIPHSFDEGQNMLQGRLLSKKRIFNKRTHAAYLILTRSFDLFPVKMLISVKNTK